MKLEEIKKMFNAKNVSLIRCYDTDTKEEVYVELDKSINELLKRNLIYKVDNISICTSKKAYELSTVNKKVMLEDVINYKQPNFDRELSLADWHAKNRG